MTTVHRLLDEAFARVTLTPEVADLKEEIRSGLLDRAAELEATGVPGDQAARRALAELGDVDALIAEVTGPGVPDAGVPGAPASPPGGPRPTSWAHSEALMARHRVRPRPGFVVGVVLAALVAAGSVTGYVLAALDGSFTLPALLSVLAGLAVGWIAGSSLAQETTTNHPLPRPRAALWGVAGALVVAGLGVGLVALPAWDSSSAAAWIVGGAAVAVVGGVLFAWLGVTQTNRRKAWVRQLAHELDGGNRFTQDPAAAARFGLYTAVIGVVALALTATIGLSAGWRWSWLALVAGWAAMMLLLARMLFAQDRTQH